MAVGCGHSDRAEGPSKGKAAGEAERKTAGIRVVLAEDHTLVRDGIRTLLGLVSDITLVGEAADGEEAMRVVEATKPDVLLLDMRMPKADGLRVVTCHLGGGASVCAVT